MAARVDPDKCLGCFCCVEVCPQNALKVVNEKVVVDEDECDECGACTEVCPNDAIRLRRRTRVKRTQRPS